MAVVVYTRHYEDDDETYFPAVHVYGLDVWHFICDTDGYPSIARFGGQRWGWTDQPVRFAANGELLTYIPTAVLVAIGKARRDEAVLD